MCSFQISPLSVVTTGAGWCCTLLQISDSQVHNKCHNKTKKQKQQKNERIILNSLLSGVGNVGCCYSV